MTEKEKSYIRVTMSLPIPLVVRIDELAKSQIRTRSGMASWLMQSKLGLIGDADIPDDIQETTNEH